MKPVHATRTYGRHNRQRSLDGQHITLQAKLAKLRRELLEPGSGSGAGGGGKGEGFDVNKVGDARVGLVGAPLQLAQRQTVYMTN